MTERERNLILVVKESHKLLRHYSELLNMYDQGKRKIPKNMHSWIAKILRREKERKANVN